MATEQELESARRTHAEALREAGAQPYPNDHRPNEAERKLRDEVVRMANDESIKGARIEGETIVSRAGSLVTVEREGQPKERLPQDDELTGDEPMLPLYGRVVAKRGPFIVLQTPHGRAQAFVPNKGQDLSEREQAELKALDLADHIAVRGPIIGTRRGDAAVKVQEYRHVSKALLPPPAKFQGLKDVEKRYRQRYVDLFANPEVAEVFVARSLIVTALRRYLDERDYLEVETPLLHAVRGGATAKPFSTHHNALDMSLFLRVAPELYLKRLVVGGYDRVYEVGRNFRNEGISTRHNPEFTMLECYTAYATYLEIIDLIEGMIRAADAAVARRFEDRLKQDRTFSLVEPFVRVRMVDAIAERVRRSGEEGLEETPFDGELDAAALGDEIQLANLVEGALERLPPAEQKDLRRATTHGHRIFALFELLVEEDLEKLYRTEDGARSRPVFVTHFPWEVSPLARRSDEDPAFTDRFELFVEGRELLNAFSELNDPDDQLARFEDQESQREEGNDEAMDVDHDYVRALMHGMPPAAGFGIGIDRLVMALCGQASIRDVILFPLMRREHDGSAG